MDPCLFSHSYGSTFILGKSGSGKTTLIHAIVKKYLKTKKKIFTLNVKGSEYRTLSPSIVNIDFSGLAQIPTNSVIIIEDVIFLSTLQSKQIRHLLNYYTHHCLLKVFLVSHHVFKTNTWNLLPFFNYIIFTGTQSNMPILRTFFSTFKIDKSIEQIWLDQFSKAIKKHPYSYAHFDSSQQTFNIASSMLALLSKQFRTFSSRANDSNQPSDSDDLIGKLQTRFDTFLQNCSLKQEAGAIFSILISSIPPSQINLGDLTLKVFSTKANSLLNFSLIDYIMCLLSPHSSVSEANKFLHSYFKDKCQIPLIFVKNVKLRK